MPSSSDRSRQARPKRHHARARRPATTAQSASGSRRLAGWCASFGSTERRFSLSLTGRTVSIFSAGKEGIIRRFDADSDTLLAEWPAHTDWIYALAISPDGSMLASGDWSGAVQLHELRAQK